MLYEVITFMSNIPTLVSKLSVNVLPDNIIGRFPKESLISFISLSETLPDTTSSKLPEWYLRSKKAATLSRVIVL